MSFAIILAILFLIGWVAWRKHFSKTWRQDFARFKAVWTWRGRRYKRMAVETKDKIRQKVDESVFLGQ